MNFTPIWMKSGPDLKVKLKHLFFAKYSPSTGHDKDNDDQYQYDK